MKMQYSQIEELINDDSFIEWVIDPDADSKWSEWQLINSDNEKLASQAKKLILGFIPKEEKIDPKDIDRYLLEVKAKLTVPSLRNVDNLRMSPYKPKIKSYLSWAASIVLLIISGALLYINYYSADKNEQLKTDLMIEKVVPRGHKLTVTLDDGSTLILNSESKIRYGEDFTSKREVFLEGEAFFEVTKDNEKPFYIYSGDIVTMVLGTSFNIKAYPADDIVQVVVASGKVKVSDKHQSVFEEILEPNEMFQLERPTGAFKKEVVDLIEHVSWKNNVIYFKDADFNEISSVLEKWYNVEFSYQKAPDIKKFNGVFKGKSLEEVLDGISFTVKFSYRIEGKNVFINN